MKQYITIVSSLQLLSVYGNATFVREEEHVSAALHFPGTAGSYATTPTFNITKTSFSISFWLKIFPDVLTRTHQYIYTFETGPFWLDVYYASVTTKWKIGFRGKTVSGTLAFSLNGG
jgi:hypothetical protein